MHVHRCEPGTCLHPNPLDLQIIELLSQGMPNRRIGLRLNRSPYTIRNRLMRLYQDLQVSDRASLVRRAFELGVLHVELKDQAA